MYFSEDTVRQVVWIGQGSAFPVIDRLAVVSDRSTANEVPSDIEIASAKRAGETEE